jgi:hypothetical protein
MHDDMIRGHPTYHEWMVKHPVKQLLKDGPQFLRILTYAEVFGGSRPSLSDFRGRLASFPKMPLVKVCALLNAFLRSDASSDEVLNFATHKAMIRAYFSGPVANAILAVASGDSPRVACRCSASSLVIDSHLVAQLQLAGRKSPRRSSAAYRVSAPSASGSVLCSKLPGWFREVHITNLPGTQTEGFA